MHQEAIQKNLALVNQRIDSVCKEFSRTPSSVRLLAVSKTHPIAAIKIANSCGQIWFGENYVDELIEKSTTLKELKLKWSFIGTLQSNKIQKLVLCADEIQTVASLKHAKFIDRYAQESHKKPFPIFICVNLGEENQKSGVTLSDAPLLVKEIQDQCPNILIKGLMSIPPANLSDEKCGDHIPDLFKKLNALNQDLGFKELSLGMTQDLRIAIAAGATTVRIGTAIFGSRL